MPANVDQANFIVDCNGIQQSNFDLDQIKGLIKIASVYTERVNQIYLLDMATLMKVALKLIYPFMPAMTKGKLKNVT
jgi:hypothetical protein